MEIRLWEVIHELLKREDEATEYLPCEYLAVDLGQDIDDDLKVTGVHPLLCVMSKYKRFGASPIWIYLSKKEAINLIGRMARMIQLIDFVEASEDKLEASCIAMDELNKMNEMSPTAFIIDPNALLET